MTSREFDILIIGGVGHIGLPLGMVFAHAGLQVALHDINVEHKRVVSEGRMPFHEAGADELLPKVLNRTLHVVDELSAAQQSKAIFITIGTPLDAYMNPRVDSLLKLASQLGPHLRDDHLIVLRSTVLPGTTDLLANVISRTSQADVAFCPERVAQGHMIREMKTFPQIISGSTVRAVERAKRLFQLLDVEPIETTMKEAEFAKLFCNAWRYIQFAAANQFYMLAARDGLRFDRIHRAMTKDYPRMNGFPAPGFAAGPCLMKDTMQLAAYADHDFALGQSAMFVNEGLASFVVEQLKARMGHSLVNRRIGILGMSFKAGSDDIRDSLSYKVRKLLVAAGAEVRCTDEYVSNAEIEPLGSVLEWAEGVIVGTPHSAYRTLKIPANVEVADVWRVLPVEPL